MKQNVLKKLIKYISLNYGTNYKDLLKANKTEMSISVIIPRGIVVSFLIKTMEAYPTNTDGFSIASNYSCQKIKFSVSFFITC